jgi:ABC-2 type transport system permease protein
LLLFGIGYRVEAQPVRTVFVMSRDNPFRAYLDDYTTGISPLLHFAGLYDSTPEAQQLLREGNADLVVVVPEDPVQQISNSQQAELEIYHNKIDPFEIDYIEAFARIYTDELNRRILSDLAERGQEDSASVEETLDTTAESAEQMRTALEQGDSAQANAKRQELAQALSLLSLGLNASSQMLAGVEQRFSAEGQNVAPVVDRLEQLQQRVNALPQYGEGQDSFSDEIAEIREIEQDVQFVREGLGSFRDIAPGVLVSPFRAEVQTVSDVPLRLSDFYVPSALALLVQHLSVTFAGLSIVRERRGGTMEIFQVSPLSALEGLLGKYVSYFIFEAVLVVVLTLLIRVVIDVPMLGALGNFAAVTAVLVFTSLGMGFVISLLAETTSQAVQYSMIVLLASLFFSGFFLTLDLLKPFVRVVSWLLPATYATQMLQNNMLRGIFTQDDLISLGILGLMGAAYFVLAWLLLKRKMARR